MAMHQKIVREATIYVNGVCPCLPLPLAMAQWDESALKYRFIYLDWYEVVV